MILLLLCVQRLDKALKSALRSDLEDVSLALLMSPANFDAYLIRKATKVQSCSFTQTFSYTIFSFSVVAFSADSLVKHLKSLILIVLNVSLASQEKAK